MPHHFHASPLRRASLPRPGTRSAIHLVSWLAS
jgi:hypothetical protein